MVVAAIARAIGGRVPLIAGVSAGTPSAAIALAADAAEAGATALMMLPPLGYHGDAHEVAAFYRAVAEAGGLPLMAYNNPAASGSDMPPAQKPSSAQSSPTSSRPTASSCTSAAAPASSTGRARSTSACCRSRGST